MFKLRELRKYAEMTQKEMAELLKCGQPNIVSIERGGRNLTKEQYDILNDKFGKEFVNTFEGFEKVVYCDPSTVPLLPISAQAGTLNEFIVTVKNNECERVISPIMGADYAITVAGDSMSPDYPCGSQVIIKKIDESVFIHWGHVFVLDTKNGVVMKKVCPVDGDDKSIICESINPKYPPFKVRINDIYGFYRVLMCMIIK